MKNRYLMLVEALLAIVALAASVRPIVAQQAATSTGIPVQMVVTVEARHGTDVPPVSREDVMVYQGRDRVPVTDWVPLQGDRAGLELFILLDDSSSTSLGSHLEDLRAFINRQPATTAIGVGYMRNGSVEILQNCTQDHASAAKSLRLPTGSGGGSPYFSVEDLIKRWPVSPVRREILLISDGIDRFGGAGPANPYVEAAVEGAQRAGIVIFTIYTPGVGHYGHSFWRVNWGQNYLSQIADETGGEAYYLGFGTPVSFTPYLDELTHRLNLQYLLTFAAKPEKKAAMQDVKLRTELPNVDFAAADKVYVPATSQQ